MLTYTDKSVCQKLKCLEHNLPLVHWITHFAPLCWSAPPEKSGSLLLFSRTSYYCHPLLLLFSQPLSCDWNFLQLPSPFPPLRGLLAFVLDAPDCRSPWESCWNFPFLIVHVQPLCFLWYLSYNRSIPRPFSPFSIHSFSQQEHPHKVRTRSEAPSL